MVDSDDLQEPDEELPHKDFLDTMDSWDEIEIDPDPELEEMRRRRDGWVKPLALFVAISMAALAAPMVARFLAHIFGN